MLKHIMGVAALWAASGCSVLGPEVRVLTDLEEARERWENARPSAYEFAVERMCFCGVESRGPVRLRVQGTTAVERVYVDSGAPVAAELGEWFPTVDGLFDMLASALESDAHEVRATYDPVLGVPVDIWIDYMEFAVDEEQGMRVTEQVEAVSGP